MNPLDDASADKKKQGRLTEAEISSMKDAFFDLGVDIEDMQEKLKEMNQGLNWLAKKMLKQVKS